MKTLKRGLVVLTLIGAAMFFGASSAQAWLYTSGAEDKAKQNTWNNFCHATYNYCSSYPAIYAPSQRVDGNTVDTYISATRLDYGKCFRRIRVRKQADNSLVVLDSQSSYWSCPY